MSDSFAGQPRGFGRKLGVSRTKANDSFIYKNWNKFHGLPSFQPVGRDDEIAIAGGYCRVKGWRKGAARYQGGPLAERLHGFLHPRKRLVRSREWLPPYPGIPVLLARGPIHGKERGPCRNGSLPFPHVR